MQDSEGPNSGRLHFRSRLTLLVQMIEAGWCYDPSPEYDDGVTCCYCNLSLDGWEPKDNPVYVAMRLLYSSIADIT